MTELADTSIIIIHTHPACSRRAVTGAARSKEHTFFFWLRSARGPGSLNRRKGLNVQLDSAFDGVVKTDIMNDTSPELEYSQILDVVRSLENSSARSSKRSSYSGELRRRSARNASLSSSIRPASLSANSRLSLRSRNSIMWRVMKETSGASLEAAFCPSEENDKARAYVKSLDDSVLST